MYYKPWSMMRIVCSGALLFVLHSGWSQSPAVPAPVILKEKPRYSTPRKDAVNLLPQPALPDEGETQGIGAAISTSATVMLTVLKYDASELKATIKEDALFSLWLVTKEKQPGMPVLRVSMLDIDYPVGNSREFRMAVVLNF